MRSKLLLSSKHYIDCSCVPKKKFPFSSIYILRKWVFKKEFVEGKGFFFCSTVNIMFMFIETSKMNLM